MFNSVNSGSLAREARSGAPWVSKTTHPRKFGNHVTDRPSDRPSVRTTGKPMFNLTLSSYCSLGAQGAYEKTDCTSML